MQPLTWVRQSPNHQIYRADDPGVGEFSTSCVQTEESIVRFRFVPALPEGLSFSDALDQSRAIYENLKQAAFDDPEYNRLRSYVSASNDVGYAFSQSAVERAIEVARARPAKPASHDRNLAAAGFKYRSFLNGNGAPVKLYDRNEKTGGFTMWRACESVHLTWEFNATPRGGSGWENLFRLNMMAERHPNVVPDYFDLDVAVLQAIDLAQMYVDEGLILRKNHRKRA